MKFEIGKCYKHENGTLLRILCEADSTVYGDCLIAERMMPGHGYTFTAVSKEFEAAADFKEVSETEWIDQFEPTEQID